MLRFVAGNLKIFIDSPQLNSWGTLNEIVQTIEKSQADHSE